MGAKPGMVCSKKGGFQFNNKALLSACKGPPRRRRRVDEAFRLKAQATRYKSIVCESGPMSLLLCFGNLVVHISSSSIDSLSPMSPLIRDAFLEPALSLLPALDNY